MIMIKILCYEVTAMTTAQQQQAAKNFAAYWKDKGYEKGESQPFWLSLLRDVYGVEHPEQFIQFEEQVHLDHTSFIDGTSMTILGTGDAAKLPKIAGRFVAWDGTVFQSYYFPNYK